MDPFCGRKHEFLKFEKPLREIDDFLINIKNKHFPEGWFLKNQKNWPCRSLIWTRKSQYISFAIELKIGISLSEDEKDYMIGGVIWIDDFENLKRYIKWYSFYKNVNPPLLPYLNDIEKWIEEMNHWVQTATLEKIEREMQKSDLSPAHNSWKYLS